MSTPAQTRRLLQQRFAARDAQGPGTGAWRDLPPALLDAIGTNVEFLEDELPAVVSAPSPEAWTLVTTQRVIWRHEGGTRSLPHEDIAEVSTTLLPRFAAGGPPRHRMMCLLVEDGEGERHRLEVEAGRPLRGLLLLLTDLRNRAILASAFPG